MGQMPDHIKGLLITGIGVIILSPDALLIRMISLDPWSLLVWRGLLMAAGLYAYLAFVQGRKTIAHCRAVGKAGLALAVLLAVSTILFIVSLSNTSVANTLIIISAAPLFAALLSRGVLAETVALRTWLAILTAMGGIVIVVSGSTESGHLLGDLAAVGTAACMAGTLSIVRWARKVDMTPAVAGSGLVSALLALPFAAPLAVTGQEIELLLLLGLVVLPISFGMITVGPRYLPAPEVSLIMLLETVLGPFWVWLVMTEEPSLEALLGGAVVLGTLAIHASLSLRQQTPATGI